VHVLDSTMVSAYFLLMIGIGWWSHRRNPRRLVSWIAALLGPISVPLLPGMLPWFRRCGRRAALTSWAGGLLSYALVYYVLQASRRSWPPRCRSHWPCSPATG
jgi:hypothetical protein